jgi:hypothetical protein
MSDSKELSDREKLIRAKQAAGLSREHAEQVVANQEANDAALEPKKPAAPKK